MIQTNLLKFGLAVLAGIIVFAVFKGYGKNDAKNGTSISEAGAKSATATAGDHSSGLGPALQLELPERLPVQQRNVHRDSPDFAWLYEDISSGNPISWSGRGNAVSPFRPGHNSLCYNLQRQLTRPVGCNEKKRPMVVVQGHSVPLPHEMYASRSEGTITPFGHKRCSMACCPSTYSCDSGCVCGL